jgi:hypothetical protein
MMTPGNTRAANRRSSAGTVPMKLVGGTALSLLVLIGAAAFVVAKQRNLPWPGR